MKVATAAPTPTIAEASSAFGRETRPPRTRSTVASATFPTAASVAMEWAYRHVPDAKPRGFWRFDARSRYDSFPRRQTPPESEWRGEGSLLHHAKIVAVSPSVTGILPQPSTRRRQAANAPDA